LAKLTPPRTAGLVARPRLFALLQSAASGRVTWISGPPGAGKTSLVATYAAARNESLTWLTLDADDRDPATLFYYLALAVPQRRARIALPLLRAENAEDLAGYARRFFRLWFAALKTSIVVIDDYHAAAGPAVDAALTQALMQISPELQI